MTKAHRFTEDSFRKEPWFKSLCTAMLSCETEEDMAGLLRDIGTLSELQSWSERLEVAKQLVSGLSYRKVAEMTGASTTTVTRVAKFIENGAGGYRKVLQAHRHHRLGLKSVRQGSDAGDMRRQSGSASEGKPSPVSVLQKYLQKNS